MRSDNLQQLFAGTRLRFGMSLLVLITVSVILPMLLFSVGSSIQGAYSFFRVGFYVLVLIIGISLISLYVLRLRQIQRPSALGGVDKFEPVSCGSDVDHAEEALGELVITGGDGAVDFQATEKAFDMVSLFIERAVIFDLHAAV